MNLTVSATPRELCPGETAQVNASISEGDSKELGFLWSVNGQPISQGRSFVFGTVGRDPGTYTVALTVNGAAFNTATAGHDHRSRISTADWHGSGQSGPNLRRREIHTFGYLSGPMRRQHPAADLCRIRRLGARKSIRLDERTV